MLEISKLPVCDKKSLERDLIDFFKPDRIKVANISIEEKQSIASVEILSAKKLDVVERVSNQKFRGQHLLKYDTSPGGIGYTGENKGDPPRPSDRNSHS
ncbi:MAG: hypothetical protein AAF921_10045 [Cyanobacteria bacterium P01_D01_bin.44]